MRDLYRVPFTLVAVTLCLSATTAVATGAGPARGAHFLDAPQSGPEHESILWRNLGARVIDDGLVVGGSAGIQFLTSAAFGAPSASWFETRRWRLSAWTMLTMSIPLWTYFTLLDAAPSSATLGKRLLGIHVVNDDGTGLSVPRSLLRTALSLIGWDLAHVSMFVPRNFARANPVPGQYVGLCVATAWLVADLVVTVVTGGHKGLADLILGTKIVRTVPERVPVAATRW
ncbi:MAG: RDD family protein [Myxococcaceae bacterium]|nr:RDD family protein [Myxococcaceae bacterium]